MDTNPEQGVADLMAALDEPIEATQAVEKSEAATAAETGSEVVTDQAETVEETEEEAEFDGVKVRGKKDAIERLKAERSMHADYTQKTQKAAELTRQAEERLQLVAKQEQLIAASVDMVADVKLAQARLAQFQAIDWQAIAQQDPAQATQLMAAYQTAQTDAAKKQQEFQRHAAQHQQLIALQRQQVLEKGRSELAARIPNFTPELGKRIAESTQQGYGYTAEELEQVTDPRLVQILHDAMQFRAIKAQQPKAVRTLAEAPKVIKPSAPQPVRQNQAAMDRLKKTGRAENLIDFL